MHGPKNKKLKKIHLKVKILLAGHIRTDRLKVRKKDVAFALKAIPKFVIWNLGLNSTF